MPTAARRSKRWPATRTRYSPWPSAPTATWWRPAATTAKSRSGKSPTAALSRHSTPPPDSPRRLLPRRSSCSRPLSVVRCPLYTGLMRPVIGVTHRAGLQRTTDNGPMTSPERPRLRPGLAAARDPADRRYVFLWDQFRLTEYQARVTLLELDCLQLFDGTRTVHDVHSEAARSAGGKLMPLAPFESLVRRLEEALFLDGPKYRERLASPV